VRLVLSRDMADALDRVSGATKIDRTNLIRMALVDWLDAHPSWWREGAEGDQATK